MGEYVVETDVLVVGGGMAGCFAAIKAKEKGVDVALVDKGYVGRSGQTPFAGGFAVFNPVWGHKLGEWMNQVRIVGEYVNNRDWTEAVFKDSHARYQDLMSWGARDNTDEVQPRPHRPPRGSLPPRVTAPRHLVPDFPDVLRKQVLKVGVKILDRVMVAELLKQDGKVVGAVGFPMDRLDTYVVNTKAIVLCAGAGGFKPSGWPIHGLTADGHAMAYRVGAEITGKEFADTHATRANIPALVAGAHPTPHSTHYPGSRPGPPPAEPGSQRRRRGTINAEGQEVPGIGTLFLDMEFEAHAGRAPLSRGGARRVGGAASGMSVHTTEGIWPVNTQGASSIPGLYAAGDCLGTMFDGAVYTVGGSALATAAVTGSRAGVTAAEKALHTEKADLDEDAVTKVKEGLYAPLERKGGFTPRWVTQVLRNLMIPYYIMYIKHATRMKATLTLVEFLRDHLVPKLYATDPHDLRLAHETKNMVLNAEMRLRASLFRTESRGCHYREDYPQRKDPEWLVWVLLKETNGQMTTTRKPIPEDWWPDLSKPYEARYPVRLPGEKPRQ